MKLYKVQELGLPERWNNFTVFSSEVSRLVLLSDRGRTHGSIWGVPPFLEGIFRATITATMTTSYFYSYITTSAYQTTYTITIKAKQSAYSLTGEWWESNNGRNWGKVTSTTGRDGRSCWYGDPDWNCQYYTGVTCRPYSCTGPQSPTASQLMTTLTANGRQIVSFNPPIILYFRANESVVVSGGITSYTLVGSSAYCYAEYLGCTTECVREETTCQTYPYYTQCRTRCLEYRTTCYYQCVQRVTEWSRTYKLQAIELVDWDTGEVYASLNQTSLTFNINRNTIVRFKYVLKESWSRSWEVILQPPPPTPDKCQQILNDPKERERCSGDWCSCLRQFDPEAWKNTPCCYTIRSCLSVSVDFCCSGDDKYSCLNSKSGQGGKNCVEFTAKEAEQGVTKPIPPVSWSASWSLKGGWVYDRIVQVGDYNPPYCTGSASGNGASGKCCIALSGGNCDAGNVGPNKYYSTTVVIVFKKT